MQQLRGIKWKMWRKNNNIEKKIGEIDKLYRKYDETILNMRDKGKRPLKPATFNLNGNIEQKKELCSEMEKNFMR